MSALTAIRSPMGPTDRVRELIVAEIFGPTFQGEGPSLGRRCSFLRLSGCNLHCSWCDTPYTWDWTGRTGTRFDRTRESSRMRLDTVFEELVKHGTHMLVITGGEPLLQQRRLVPLLDMCAARDWRVEVETAATIVPLAEIIARVTQFNVSPKLANSGNEEDKRYRPEAIDALQASERSVWKFVVSDRADLGEVQSLVDRHGLRPIYIMPEGSTSQVIIERTREIASDVLARGWNLTTRLQILLWGNQRGV